jgi:hypothetical protein
MLQFLGMAYKFPVGLYFFSRWFMTLFYSFFNYNSWWIKGCIYFGFVDKFYGLTDVAAAAAATAQSCQYRL